MSDPGNKKSSTGNPGKVVPAGSGPETTGRPIVEELTTIVRGRNGEGVYIGWGPDGHAAATKDSRALSGAGQDILRIYGRARNLVVPVVPYTNLVPVEYSYIKLKDLDSPAEDYFVINVKDAQGESQEYRVGELELLNGIVNARIYLQDSTATGDLGQRIIPSEAKYTVIAPCFEIDDPYTALAILFKPPLKEVPQEATFQYFVVSVLRFLWQNDKKDDLALRKGYYHAVQEYIHSKTDRVPLLLRMTFKSEETAREKWEALKRAIYKRTESPSTANDETDDLNQQNMETLFSVAAVMLNAGRYYLDKNSPSRRR